MRCVCVQDAREKTIKRPAIWNELATAPYVRYVVVVETACGRSATTWQLVYRPGLWALSGFSLSPAWFRDACDAAAPECSGYVSAPTAPHLDGNDRLCGRRRSRRLERAPAMVDRVTQLLFERLLVTGAATEVTLKRRAAARDAWTANAVKLSSDPHPDPPLPATLRGWAPKAGE